MRNRKNNQQSSDRRKENNNSDAPRKYGRKSFRPKVDIQKRRKSDDGSMRLNQYLAHAGICSRREADQLIEAGVVAINGKAITQMGYRVQESDVVKFNGRTLKTDKKRYLLLNKPRNYSCRLDHLEKKDSVFELIKGSCKEKVLPIGKLNKNHSGLLIFTNENPINNQF